MSSAVGQREARSGAGAETRASRRRPWVRRLGLSLAVLAIPGVLGELLARSGVPPNGRTLFRAGTLEDLHAELRPGLTSVYRGQLIEINASGFRGPEAPARVPGLLRVALVGDSFTFGNGVPWDATLGQQLAGELERLGRPAQVLNLGVPGYNAANAAVVAERRALELDPDVVVYVFFANDVEPAPPRVEVPPDAVIDPFQGFPLGSALLQWLSVRAKSALLRLGVDVNRGSRRYKVEVLEAGGAELLRGALVRMRDACSARGVRFEVAIYPFLLAPRSNPFAEIDAIARAQCDELGIPCTYLLDAFPPGADLESFWVSPYDSHPDAAGHAHSARLLASVLAGGER